MFKNTNYHTILNNTIYVFTSDIILYNSDTFDTNETSYKILNEGMLPFSQEIDNMIEVNLMLSNLNNIAKNLVYLDFININNSNKNNIFIEHPVVLNIDKKLDKIVIKNINNVNIFIGLNINRFAHMIIPHKDPVMNIFYDVYYTIGSDIKLSQMYLIDNIKTDDKVITFTGGMNFNNIILNEATDSNDNNLFSIQSFDNNITLVAGNVAPLLTKSNIKLDLKIISGEYTFYKKVTLQVFKSDNIILNTSLPLIKNFPLLLQAVHNNIITWDDVKPIIKYFLNNKDCPHLKLINILKNGIISTKKQFEKMIPRDERVFKLNDTEVGLFDIILSPIITYLNSWKNPYEDMNDLSILLTNLNNCLIALTKMKNEYVELNELMDRTPLIKILNDYINVFSEYYILTKKLIESIFDLLKLDTLNDMLVQSFVLFKTFSSFGSMNVKVLTALHTFIKHIHSNIPAEFKLEKMSPNYFILTFDSGLTNRNIVLHPSNITISGLNYYRSSLNQRMLEGNTIIPTIIRDISSTTPKFNIILDINKVNLHLPSSNIECKFDVKIQSDMIEYNKTFTF